MRSSLNRFDSSFRQYAKLPAFWLLVAAVAATLAISLADGRHAMERLTFLNLVLTNVALLLLFRIQRARQKDMEALRRTLELLKESLAVPESYGFPDELKLGPVCKPESRPNERTTRPSESRLHGLSRGWWTH